MEGTKPDLKSAQLSQLAPKLNLDLYIFTAKLMRLLSLGGKKALLVGDTTKILFT